MVIRILPQKRKREDEEIPKQREKKVRFLQPQPSSDEQQHDIRMKRFAREKTQPPVSAISPSFSFPTGAVFEAFQAKIDPDLYENDRADRKRWLFERGLLHPDNLPKPPSKTHVVELRCPSERKFVDYVGTDMEGRALAHREKRFFAIHDTKKASLSIAQTIPVKFSTVARKESAETKAKEGCKRRPYREKIPTHVTQPAKDLEHVNSNELQEEDNVREQLGMEFGNRKAQKAIKSFKRNDISTAKARDMVNASPEAIKEAIKSDPAAAAVLESMTEAAENAPTRQSLQTIIDQAKPKPKHNPNARRVGEIYHYNKIIGDYMMRRLRVKHWCTAIEDGQAIRTPSRFVSRRLAPIVHDYSLDDDIAVVKIKILRYILAILRFHMALFPSYRRGFWRLPKQKILERRMGDEASLLSVVQDHFSDGREVSKWHIDKMRTYVAVFSLIVDSYETDINDLREDLGLENRKMVQYFKEIGARVESMTAEQQSRMEITKAQARYHKIAKLKLPLEFPRTRVIPLVRGPRS